MPNSVGAYIDATVCGVPLYFTADTGASQTILSKRIYDKIPNERKPKLKQSVHNITCAGGTVLKEHGKAMFDLQLGSLQLTKEIIIADIGDEGLLGADIIQEDEKGPGDLMLSKGILRLRGLDIEILRVGKDNKVRKVTAADHYMVPGYCEQVIDVFIERFPEDDCEANRDVVVEPCGGFTDRYPLVMASTVVDMNSSPTQKVRLLNPSSLPVSINQDSVIGVAERYDELRLLVDSEDPSQLENNSAVRRIQFMNKTATETVPIVTGQTVQGKLPPHLEELCANSGCNRTEDERKTISDLLIRHANAFSQNEYDLGVTHLAEHVIDTGNAKPVRCPPRRVPLAFADEERQVIETMEKQGIIRKSHSCWSSPLCLVRKKNGKVRPCIDYRAVNKVTQTDNFPIPRTRDCLDAVAGAKLFSTFDVTSSYHQIPVREQDIPKTAFITKYGLYEHCTMPMGMKNSSATFQRCMEAALQGLQWLTCLIYLDDVVVFASSFDEHVERVDQVLDRVQKAGLKLKPDKCHLFEEKVHFLGHIISGEGVCPSPDNVAKILQFAVPKDVSQVRALVGMGSYYRRHIQNFSGMMKPIIDLTKKGKKFVWTEQCQSAFEKLKEALVSPEIMAYPLDVGEYFLDCDSSDHAIGGVLSQIQGGEERVISYGSKILNKAERNYCVTDKELLALRYFIEYYRQYLLGRRFTVRTDHQALSYLFSFKEPRGRLARYLEILAAYDFSVEYRKGSGHSNADGMSRCVSPWDCQCNEVDTMEPLKCGPCKRCEKRALDMKSSLLMGRIDKKEEELCQPQVKGECESSINQVTHINKSMGPNNNGQSNESGVELNVVTEMQVSGNDISSSNSTQGLLGLRSGNNTEESKGGVPNGSLTEQRKICIEWGLITGGGVRAVETRSKSKQGEFQQSNSAGGMSGRNTDASAVLFDKVILSKFSDEEMASFQQKDPDISFVYENLLSGNKRPSNSEAVVKSSAARHYWVIWNSLCFTKGLVFKESFQKNGFCKYYQLLVPRTLKQEVLKEAHDARMGGHFGCRKTYEKVKQKYYWYEMKDDVSNWVLKCDVCAADKIPQRKPKAPLGSLGVGATLATLSTDLVGPFPITPRRNRFILVLTDHFTKWVEIFAIPDQTAATTASVILNEVIARYGAPLSIHSDRGSNYESQIFHELCQLMEIKKTRTSVRNPKGNGQAEKFNKTLVRMIKAYLKGEQEDWDLNLGCLAAAYRATPHTSTGLSPNMMMLGREVRIPAELRNGALCEPEGDTVTSYGEYVDWLRDRIQAAHDIARNYLDKAAKRHKYTYDTRLRHMSYEPGDCAWYLHERRVLGISPKLQMAYELCVILRKINDVNFLIRLEGGQDRVVHHDKLKNYEGVNKPGWLSKAFKNFTKGN